MNDLSARLREHDPVRLEAGLPAEARDAMRRTIVAAAGARVAGVPQWRQPLALAAMALLTVLGVGAAHRFAGEREAASIAVKADPVPHSGATQVDFRTPGGTRIIWTIDPDFRLGGTLP